MSDKTFRIWDIDQDIKHTVILVFGYIKSIQMQTDIPTDIQFIIVKYYWIITNTMVYVIGNNKQGQLGLYHYNNAHKLTPQKYQYNIQHIYNSHSHTIYSQYNNQNYWFSGKHCSKAQRFCAPYKVKLFSDKNVRIKHIFSNNNTDNSFWMDINNNIYGMGNFTDDVDTNTDNKSLGIRIKYLQNIKDIQCATFYSLALDDNNNVYSAGYSEHGGLGHGSDATEISEFSKIKALINKKIVKIKTGYDHSLFLSSDFNLYVCGSNDHGELGLGYINNNIYTPVIIEYFKSRNINIIDIECGRNHNLCIDNKYNLYSFGYNNYGQCGLGLNDENILEPQQISMLKNEKIIKIKCGTSHSYCYSLLDNHYLWGRNYHNECIINAYRNGMNIIKSPYLMNSIIKKELNNKRIKEIFLGNFNTQIIVGME